MRLLCMCMRTRECMRMDRCMWYVHAHACAHACFRRAQCRESSRTRVDWHRVRRCVRARASDLDERPVAIMSKESQYSYASVFGSYTECACLCAVARMQRSWVRSGGRGTLRQGCMRAFASHISSQHEKKSHRVVAIHTHTHTHTHTHIHTHTHTHTV